MCLWLAEEYRIVASFRLVPVCVSNFLVCAGSSLLLFVRSRPWFSLGLLVRFLGGDLVV